MEDTKSVCQYGACGQVRVLSQCAVECAMCVCLGCTVSGVAVSHQPDACWHADRQADRQTADRQTGRQSDPSDRQTKVWDSSEAEVSDSGSEVSERHGAAGSRGHAVNLGDRIRIY